MTATLLASAVEEKKLSWTTRPTDVFPSLAASIRPEFRTITLRQLLQHRAGIPAYVTAESLSVVPPLQGTPRDQRRAFALWQLTQAPAAVPGMYLYSNGGYAIAAAMAEETLGAAYETLLGQRLFTPLGITAGFGWPAKDDPNQPWGHTSASGHYVPQDPTDPLQQLPPMGSPAGDVNMSISDYTKFIQMHLGGLRGQDGLLPAQAIQEMHTPTGDYAMGWQVIKPTLGYPVSLHTGSAGSFSCFVRIDPHADLALAVITNAAGESADMAIADIATWLVGQMQR
jgi:CubicO group peptidase (beta-lactamase class C family)